MSYMSPVCLHKIGYLFSLILALPELVQGARRALTVFLAHSMAEDIKTLEEQFRQQNKSCLVLGASGETGKELLKELLERNIFSKITLIGRRQLTFEDKAYEKVVSELIFYLLNSIRPTWDLIIWVIYEFCSMLFSVTQGARGGGLWEARWLRCCFPGPWCQLLLHGNNQSKSRGCKFNFIIPVWEFDRWS